MRRIEEIQQAGEKLGYKDADLREFVKEQQALEHEREVAERAERAAARQQQKLDTETEQKKIEAAQEQKRLESKREAVIAKKKIEAEQKQRQMAAEKEKREAEMAAEEKRREARSRVGIEEDSHGGRENEIRSGGDPERVGG